MKKVKKPYKTSTVHPSPPPPISDHLALLPATILTLTLTLSQEDKEILAYLLSKKTTTAPTHHSPLFNCTCFRCYITYWVRWDSSPNRHLIHQIIDAVENDGLLAQTHKHKSKKDKKKKPFPNTIITTTSNNNINNNNIVTYKSCDESEGDDGAESTRSMELSQPSLNEFETVVGSEEVEEEEEEEEGGMMRKMVNFLGERIWSVWT